MSVKIPKGFTRWVGTSESNAHSIRVEVIYRNGERKIEKPGALMWDWDPTFSGADIIAYRVICLKPGETT